MRLCSQKNGTAIHGNWSSNLHRHQCFESRNLETKERQKYHSLQWKCHEHRTIILNQFCESSRLLRIGFYKFALKEENNTFLHPWIIDLWDVLEPEKVDMLISFPNLAQGNLMIQNQAKFRILEKKVRMTRLCEKALLQDLVTAKSRYQVRPDGKDGWGQITPLCREYTCSRVFLEFRMNGVTSQVKSPQFWMCIDAPSEAVNTPRAQCTVHTLLRHAER